MIHAAVATALTAAFLSAGPVPTPDGATEPQVHEAAVVQVNSEVKSLPHFWSSTSFPELRCPADRPYLEDRIYYHRVTIPKGMEVRAFGGPEVDVATLTVFDRASARPVGVVATTATSYAWAPRSVQIVLHCTA
ncbi:hypothetical protein [Agromyces aerolatus]|uniref:hypothetical protein n=1 Tax=Agromyces sp. LY-1074 TaxID=3074080 RepID=UPI002864423C|nr:MULTISPECIES: hypothetical protein [unclassified Agromyces]MDR5700056.1 hypothetical protein [Agromyces sp. LY-1074]MDR5706576.1 hypothetical protein [Agromyces sp. LY-1358]